MKRIHLSNRQVEVMLDAMRIGSRQLSEDAKLFHDISKADDSYFKENKLITREAAAMLSEDRDRRLEEISDVMELIENAEIIIEREDD